MSILSHVVRVLNFVFIKNFMGSKGVVAGRKSVVSRTFFSLPTQIRSFCSLYVFFFVEVRSLDRSNLHVGGFKGHFARVPLSGTSTIQRESEGWNLRREEERSSGGGRINGGRSDGERYGDPTEDGTVECRPKKDSPMECCSTDSDPTNEWGER